MTIAWTVGIYGWWSMISSAMQKSLAATLVHEAPHILHARERTAPPLEIFLHGELPAESHLSIH